MTTPSVPGIPLRWRRWPTTISPSAGSYPTFPTANGARQASMTPTTLADQRGAHGGADTRHQADEPGGWVRSRCTTRSRQRRTSPRSTRWPSRIPLTMGVSASSAMARVPAAERSMYKQWSRLEQAPALRRLHGHRGLRQARSTQPAGLRLSSRLEGRLSRPRADLRSGPGAGAQPAGDGPRRLID